MMKNDTAPAVFDTQGIAGSDFQFPGHVIAGTPYCSGSFIYRIP